MHRILMTTLVTALWIGALDARPSLADSTEADQAGSLVEQGLTLARKGQFRKAADLFERAVKLNPDPTILHSLARAREEMGEHALAFETFRQALELDPQYIYAQDARDRMAFLERLLMSTHGRVRVTSTPGAADVYISGSGGSRETRLITPFSYWAPAGELTLLGKKDGFVESEKKLTVAAGDDTAVELVLRPVARKGFLIVSVSAPGARVFVGDKQIGVTPLEPLAVEAKPYQVRIEMEGLAPIKRDVLVLADQESRVVIDLNDPDAGLQTAPTSPWGPVLLGSGGMALVGGLVMHLSALSLAEDSRAKSAEAEGYEENEKLAAERALEEYYELRSEARTNEAVAYIGYGVAATCIGLGAYMLTSPQRSANAGSTNGSEDTALSWTPLLVPARDGFFAGTRVSF